MRPWWSCSTWPGPTWPGWPASSLLSGQEDACGAPPRVLVTTVRSRLPVDLAVFGDTPPVELRTPVRYRSRMALRWTTAESEEGGTLFPDERVAERHVGKGAYAGMEFLHVNARSIINTVPPESQMPFRHTINAYRGCSHACVYCFARPTHDYLGLGIGSDFERKIVVKVNAVERLRAELRSPKWVGDHIAMGTNTDPYQHAEGKYHLTRGIVETLSGARNPFSILTKSTLILRDAALLAAAAQRTDVGVSFSIGTLDRAVWKATEPGTPPPDRRVDALRRLTDMGIRCGVLVAPVLPGLSDREDAAARGGRGVRGGGCRLGLGGGAAPAGPRARSLPRLARGPAAGPGRGAPGAFPARRLSTRRGAKPHRGCGPGGGAALRCDRAGPLPRCAFPADRSPSSAGGGPGAGGVPRGGRRAAVAPLRDGRGGGTETLLQSWPHDWRGGVESADDRSRSEPRAPRRAGDRRRIRLGPLGGPSEAGAQPAGARPPRPAPPPPPMRTTASSTPKAGS